MFTDQLGQRHGNVDFQLLDVPLRNATRQQPWHKSEKLSNNPACFLPWPLGTELVSSIGLTPSYRIAHFEGLWPSQWTARSGWEELGVEGHAI
jgi:hypothetical protein